MPDKPNHTDNGDAAQPLRANAATALTATTPAGTDYTTCSLLPAVERVPPKKKFGSAVAAKIGLGIVAIYIIVFCALAVLTTAAYILYWDHPATTWQRIGEFFLVLLTYAIAACGIAAQVTVAHFAHCLARPLIELAPSFPKVKKLQRRFTRFVVSLLILQTLFLLLLFVLGTGIGGLQPRALFWPELFPINVVHDPYTFYVSNSLSYLIAVLALVPGVAAYGFNLLVFDFLFWILLSEWLDTRVRTLGATLTIAELYHPSATEARKFGLRGEQHGAFTAQDLPGDVHFQVALDVPYDAEKYPHSVVRPDSWVALGGRDSRQFILEELENPAFVEDLHFFLKLDGPALEQVLNSALDHNCQPQLELARKRAESINKAFNLLFAHVQPSATSANATASAPVATGLLLRGQQFVLPAHADPGAGLTIADKQDFLIFLHNTNSEDATRLDQILRENLHLRETEIQQLRQRVVCQRGNQPVVEAATPADLPENELVHPFSRGYPYRIRMSAWTPAGISTYNVNFNC